MSSIFSSLLSSEVLEIFAESGQKRFIVHAHILASQSRYLATLTAGKKDFDLSNWDGETVGRFAEFAYTGDYHSPDPLPLAEPPATPESTGRSEHGDIGRYQDTKDVDEYGALGKEIGSRLSNHKAPLSGCFPAALDPPQKPSATEPSKKKQFDPLKHDYEDLLLSHAKIYALALSLEVDPLCTLAAQRLLGVFISIGPVQLDSPMARSFVVLVRYTYSHTFRTKDPLRKIVSQFAARNFLSLQTKEMKELVSGGGDFPNDFMEGARKRLVASEKDLEDGRKTTSKNVELNHKIVALERALYKAQKESAALQEILERRQESISPKITLDTYGFPERLTGPEGGMEKKGPKTTQPSERAPSIMGRKKLGRIRQFELV